MTNEGLNDSRPESLIFSGVLDIRNFTELTARVDAFVNNFWASAGDKGELLEGYGDYVERTQSATHEKIKKVLDSACRDRRYALKPTGDGLLLAVQVCEIAEPDGIREAYERVHKETASERTMLLELVETLRAITLDEEIQKLSRTFIKSHGKKVGYEPNAEGDPVANDDMKTLQLAGGCAIGPGQFIQQDDKFFGFTSTSPDRCVDANGHAVNVAFRLCSMALRRLPEDRAGRDHSPRVLLQSRLVNLLQSDKIGQKVWVQQCTSFRFLKQLKGIEDTWCFGLDADTNEEQ